MKTYNHLKVLYNEKLVGYLTKISNGLVAFEYDGNNF